jgi:HK97 family phage major capsid protein
VATATEPVTNDQILNEMRQLAERVEKAASIPASRSGTSPSEIFAGRREERTHGEWSPRNDDWPAEVVKSLMPHYGNVQTLDRWGRDLHGRKVVCGIGPALVKMAALQNPEAARTMALNQGLMPSDYNDDKFEEEHGFVSVAKAKLHGVKTGIGNERRKTALAEGSGQTGGYLIPPQWMNELLRIAAEESFIEPRCKKVPMNSRTVMYPTLNITTSQGTGISPYYAGLQGTWQSEAALLTETEPTFNDTTLTAWDLYIYAVSSNQLLADNGIGLDAMFTQLASEAMVWYKEYAFLNGKGAGSSMPLGVLNAPAAYSQSRAVASHFKFADALAMMSHLQIRSWSTACWIMHQSVLPELGQMVDGGTSASSASTSAPAGNRLVWLNPTMTGDRGPAATKLPNTFLHGLPVFFTEKLPTLGGSGDVMLVDWGHYLLGQRLDIQIDVSPHYLFRNNQLAWRIICRCDGLPWLNNSITDANGWTVSPIVYLHS